MMWGEILDQKRVGFLAGRGWPSIDDPVDGGECLVPPAKLQDNGGY
jgi:hypothetical protein